MLLWISTKKRVSGEREREREWKKDTFLRLETVTYTFFLSRSSYTSVKLCGKMQTKQQKGNYTSFIAFVQVFKLQGTIQRSSLKQMFALFLTLSYKKPPFVLLGFK